MTSKVKLTAAQERALGKVQRGEIWQWRSGLWGQTSRGPRVRASVLDTLFDWRLIGRGVTDKNGCRDVLLTTAGEEAWGASA